MQANRKGLAINLERNLGLSETINSDENRLEQILVNLLINAVKYTAKGSITLIIAKDPNDPDSIVFQIIDTGIGMTREVKQELFESFSDQNNRNFMEQKADKSIVFK